MNLTLNTYEFIGKTSFALECFRIKRAELLLKYLNRSLSLSSTKKNEQFNNVDYSDDELISLLDVDDYRAFELIYRKYVHELFRYARKNISSREDCEEIIHDIFLDIWKRRNSLQHIVSIKGYLVSCVKFKIIRYIQRSKVKAKYIEHFKNFELGYDLQETPERTTESLTSLLLNGISELPSRCQEAITLRIQEKLSNEEIAKRMNISKKTVEVYMLRAFNHLRNKSNLIDNN